MTSPFANTPERSGVFRRLRAAQVDSDGLGLGGSDGQPMLS